LAAQGLALRAEKKKQLPRGRGGFVVAMVECWKRSSAAAALCRP